MIPLHIKKLDVIKIKSDKSAKDGSLKWAGIITVTTFFLSMALSFLASELVQGLAWYFSVMVLILMIFIGIIFDILGIAVTTADEIPFHALAAKKEKGAKQAIKLLRNAEKVSNICNDVVGDICGIISGSTTASVVVFLVNTFSLSDDMYIAMPLTAVTAALTVGGKAMGKSIAINNANQIVHFVAKIISVFRR